jgi:hypothetical protein
VAILSSLGQQNLYVKKLCLVLVYRAPFHAQKNGAIIERMADQFARRVFLLGKAYIPVSVIRYR